jgi:hypothetical protein
MDDRIHTISVGTGSFANVNGSDVSLFCSRRPAGGERSAWIFGGYVLHEIQQCFRASRSEAATAEHSRKNKMRQSTVVLCRIVAIATRASPAFQM